MAQDGCIKSLTGSLFHPQCRYHFGKKVLSAYSDWHDCLNMLDVMKDAEPVSSDKLLNFIVEGTVALMPQGVTVLLALP